MVDTTISEEYIPIIKKSILFNGLNEDQQKYLLSLLKKTTFRSGETIIQENSLSNALYILLKGSTQIHKLDKNDNISHPISYINQPGQIFGETALFKDKPRSASVQALTYTTLAELDVQKAVSICPDIYAIIVRNIALELSEKLDDASLLSVGNLRKDLKRAKTEVVLSTITIIVLFLFLFQTGMTTYYISHTADFCALKYETRPPG